MKRGVEKKKIFSKTSKILFCFLVFVILASVFVFSTTSISDSLISATGNVSATYFLGNGQYLTGISGNASWNQSFANTLYAPNTTLGIQSLYNVTASMIANLTNWTSITFNAYNSSWDNRFLVNSVNSTLNIQNLYNVTASMIANLTFLQNFTSAAVQSLINNTNIAFGILNATSFITTGNITFNLATGYNFTAGALFVNSTNVIINNSFTVYSNGNVNFTAFNSTVSIGGVNATLQLNNVPGTLTPCNGVTNHSLSTNTTGLYYCAGNQTWVLIVSG
jgi:hypothetical protein